MKILGIETSCDETSAAVVENGTKLLSNVVSSSVELHQKYGGVVPEVAAREQVKVIIPVVQEALDEAKVKADQIDAIAVTVGPGLIGSLLVGVETAKTLAVIFKKPTIPVNHLIGHIYACWLTDYRLLTTAVDRSQKAVSTQPKFPLIGLIVSGGHTDLIYMEEHQKYHWLGGTRDDAAGEAFDKVARLLGLGYPGGPEIEKISKGGNPKAYDFPRPMINEKNFDFSFSGLKTAVVNFIRSSQFTAHDKISDLAASFQAATIDVLIAKTLKAVKKCDAKEILVGGGVAANQLLRSQLTVSAQGGPASGGHGSELRVKVRFPSVEFSIDNAAMIASAAFFNFKPEKPESVQAQPGLHF